MLSKEDNNLLCRVEGDAPMGALLKQKHWVPALRAGRLEKDGAPIHVRLFGKDYVAFRATDGRVGLFDEMSPPWRLPYPGAKRRLLAALHFPWDEVPRQRPSRRCAHANPQA